MIQRIAIRISPLIERRDADTYIQLKRIGTIQHQRLLRELFAERLGALRRNLWRAIADQHREFLTAEPRNDVLWGAERSLQLPGECAQAGITNSMSVAVVDRLEMVEVENRQCQR